VANPAIIGHHSSFSRTANQLLPKKAGGVVTKLASRLFLGFRGVYLDGIQCLISGQGIDKAYSEITVKLDPSLKTR
jgi:hypothetical protein